MYALKNIAMSILERLMKPLIDAGEERGVERGIEQGEARAQEQFEAWKQEQFEAWKQEQCRNSVRFADDEPEQKDSDP